MKFDRYIVVCNPVSTAAHTTAKILRDLQALAEEKEVDAINTLPGGLSPNRQQLLRYKDALGPRTLVCIAGGDGTVNLVVNFLLGDKDLPPEARKTPILPLWAGNANDLASMLNGSLHRPLLKNILGQAHSVMIHPLRCQLAASPGNIQTFYAANYVSFGATGFTLRNMERSLHSHSPARRLAVSRFGLELMEVIGLLLRAPHFRIMENGQETIMYERVFLNGSRFAKVAAIPLRLTDRRFHRTTVRRKGLLTILFSISELVRDRAGSRVGATYDSFTVLDGIWAQLDGEPVQVKPGTTVTIEVSAIPFTAISRKSAP